MKENAIHHSKEQWGGAFLRERPVCFCDLGLCVSNWQVEADYGVRVSDLFHGLQDLLSGGD